MMFAILSLISAIVAGLCWLIWAFGAIEYPVRFLTIAIVASIIAVISAVVSRLTDEYTVTLMR